MIYLEDGEQICPQFGIADRIHEAVSRQSGKEHASPIDRVHYRALRERRSTLSRLAEDIQVARHKLASMTAEFDATLSECEALLAALGVHSEE